PSRRPCHQVARTHPPLASWTMATTPGSRARFAGCDAWVVTVSARVEHVGSLLRPPYLRDARAALSRGEMAPAEFKAVEDRAVREPVALQDDLALPVVNDGEMRRQSFQAELAAACDGFSGVSLDAWLWGAWHSNEVGDATIERPAELAVTAP